MARTFSNMLIKSVQQAFTKKILWIFYRICFLSHNVISIISIDIISYYLGSHVPLLAASISQNMHFTPLISYKFCQYKAYQIITDHMSIC